MSENISRKDFLKRVTIVGSALSAAVVAFQGCGSSDPCTDTSKLSMSDQQLRTNFKYVTVSPDPAKVCSNCALYKQPEPGSPCGGCQLFPGPVTAKGYCQSWAAKPTEG
jgi:hypothetical protein